MNITAEKLVESWLDSQTERRYQDAFVQLLVAEGWLVLHNTRHSPLEFGKDVVARSPSGELYAIQLKGNPGSRLTKSQAQDMLPQVIELIDIGVPRAYQRAPNEKHIAVVVTNGEIDEEAHLLFDQASRRCEAPLAVCSRLELWARGTLLGRISAKVGEIWPTSLAGTRAILDVNRANGRALPDHNLIASALHEAVGWPSPRSSASEKTAKLTSALLLSEIMKAPWYEAENHFALYQITIQVSVFVLPYVDAKHRSALLKQYIVVALDHCRSLLAEARVRGYDPKMIWGERNILAEIDIMGERARFLGEAAAALILGEPDEHSYDRDFARKLVEGSFGPGSLWGHAMIPSAIYRFWSFKRVDATMAPDRILVTILTGLVELQGRRPNQAMALASPYYGFEEVIYQLSAGSVGQESDVGEDSTQGRTWFAMALLTMLAKRNWKQTCKGLWRRFSRLMHEEWNLPTECFFSCILSKTGSVSSIQIYDSTWSKFIADGIALDQPEFLNGKEVWAWLIAAYLSFTPHRAWTPVLLWLDANLEQTWYSRQYLARDDPGL